MSQASVTPVKVILYSKQKELRNKVKNAINREMGKKL
jgi:hypothetical protein